MIFRDFTLCLRTVMTVLLASSKSYLVPIASSLIRWIKVFYNDIESGVVSNGWSVFFQLKQRSEVGLPVISIHIYCRRRNFGRGNRKRHDNKEYKGQWHRMQNMSIRR